MKPPRSSDYDYFLLAIANSRSSRQRKSILDFATREEILTLSEIFLNFLLGNITLASDKNFPTYSRYRSLFRLIGFKGRKSWLKRKQAALDLGKVLVIFLRDVLPVL